MSNHYDPITERGRQLQAEYLDRIGRERKMRIPPSKSEFGPDWRGRAQEMIECVRALRARLQLARQSDPRDVDE
jgi:hypothetical protein